MRIFGNVRRINASMIGCALMMMAPTISALIFTVFSAHANPAIVINQIQVQTNVSVNISPRFMIAFGALELELLAFFTILNTFSVVITYKINVVQAKKIKVLMTTAPMVGLLHTRA